MQRLYSPREVQAASRSTWWWSMASNPPCVSWCRTEHDPNEFRVEGTFACEVDFGCGVKVASFVAADEMTPFAMADREPAHICLNAERFHEDMTPEVAQIVARSLVAASDFAQAEDCTGSRLVDAASAAEVSDGCYIACARCGMPATAQVHTATANGHGFTLNVGDR